MSKKKLTIVVLGAFLILSGLAGLIAGIGNLGLIIAILALAAGVLILLYTPGVSFRIGWTVTAVYLIAVGLTGILDIGFQGMGTVMAILALAAGVLLLIRMPKIKRNVGYLLFFVWLILVGLAGLVSLGQLGMVIDIIALAAGILLIMNV
jgi:hypothetical protein